MDVPTALVFITAIVAAAYCWREHCRSPRKDDPPSTEAIGFVTDFGSEP